MFCFNLSALFFKRSNAKVLIKNKSEEDSENCFLLIKFKNEE
nr:MAG TPA: hypothetical protein [Crassvirales sp.]